MQHSTNQSYSHTLRQQHENQTDEWQTLTTALRQFDTDTRWHIHPGVLQAFDDTVELASCHASPKQLLDALSWVKG